MPPSPGSSRTRLPAFFSAASRASSAAGALILASGARCAFASGADLGAVDEQLGLAARRHDGERQRHGIVRYVRAADVEQPGDRIRAASAPRRPGRPCAGSPAARDLLLGRLAGILQRVRDDRDPCGGAGRALPHTRSTGLLRERLQLDALARRAPWPAPRWRSPNAARDRSRPRLRPPACAPATRTAWRRGSRSTSKASVSTWARACTV